MEEINKELLETLKSIFNITSGPWDDPVISEDLYNKMKNVIEKTELKFKSI
jgi:hypothetical protein